MLHQLCRTELRERNDLRRHRRVEGASARTLLLRVSLPLLFRLEHPGEFRPSCRGVIDVLIL